MKRPINFITLAVLAVAFAAASAEADVYNCNGVWTTKSCGPDAEPVKNLPQISRFNADEDLSRSQAAAGAADARGSLAPGEETPARNQGKDIPPSGLNAVRPASAQSFKVIENRIDTLARVSHAGKAGATATKQEQLRIRTELDAACSHAALENDGTKKRLCTELNSKLERAVR
jgi:hypothetical protein